MSKAKIKIAKSKIRLHLAAWALCIVIVVMREGRTLLARHSIMFMARYYLGIKLTIFQEIWAQFFIRLRRACRIAPRNHGKTELIKILIIWLIIRDRNVRIKLISVSHTLATANAMAAQYELESNPRLIADFGQFYDRKKSAQWKQDWYSVVRTKNLKDPTVHALGMDSAVTGGRCDILILDDPIDIKSVNTPELMQKTTTHITGTLVPLLEPQGKIWAVGTRKRYGDVYDFFDKNPQWKIAIDKAIIRFPENWWYEELDEPIIRDDGTEQWKRVVIGPGDPGEVLWPERMTMEVLLDLKHEMGSVEFGREYQGEVVSDEHAHFKRPWLEQCRDESISYVIGDIAEDVHGQFLFISGGCDPSLVTSEKEAKAMDSDYMVQIGLGLMPKGHRRLLKLDEGRGRTPDQVQTAIKVFYHSLRPHRYAIEDNSFGQIYHWQLVNKTGVICSKHHTGKNKSDPAEGVYSMSALFENAMMHLPYKTEEDKRITDRLIDQLHAYGADEKDDQVLALWIAEGNIQMYLAREAARRKREEARKRRRGAA